MDASEFFDTVVKRNYDDFTKTDDYRSLWNAIVSMNTVPEYMALEQFQYARVPRTPLDVAAKQIRDKDQSLIDLKTCAEALKHVRKTTYSNKQGSFEITITSTIASPVDKATWIFVDTHGVSYDLADVARRAFTALGALVP
jgi:hypothetical protein